MLGATDTVGGLRCDAFFEPGTELHAWCAQIPVLFDRVAASMDDFGARELMEQLELWYLETCYSLDERCCSLHYAPLQRCANTIVLVR